MPLIQGLPHYAKNKKYIEENVRNPIDYIILDHNAVDRQLSRCGVDHATFWNIWRITPSVYQDEDKKWYTSVDYGFFEMEDIKNKAEYILQATTDILISRSLYRAKFKSSNTSLRAITLPAGTIVFPKAFENYDGSEIEFHEETTCTAESEIIGFDGEKYISIFIHEKPFIGYIRHEKFSHNLINLTSENIQSIFPQLAKSK